jgi:hypothetical protein
MPLERQMMRNDRPVRRWDDRGPNPFALFFLAVLALLGVFSVVFVVFSLR